VAYDILYNKLSLDISAGVPTSDSRWMSGMYRVNPKGEIDGTGEIQVISLIGPIGKYAFCGSPGSQSIQQAFRAANMDNSVSAILGVFDSPGGQVDGTEAAADEIKNSSKPTVALVDSMMCSAAYWMGSAFDEIIVDPANKGFNAVIGSIGTMCMWDDNSKQLEQQGIKRHVVYADASTDKNKTFQDANDGDYTDLKKVLNGLNGTFLSAVKNNRSGKLNSSENVLTGKTYNGKEAIKYGLADRFGNFQQAVSRAYFLSKNNIKK
jgi:protease-4